MATKMSLPYWSSNQFYAIPPGTGMDDTLDVLRCDVPVTLTCTSWRIVGSFDGRGYFSYLFDGSDGEVYAGVGERQ